MKDNDTKLLTEAYKKIINEEDFGEEDEFSNDSLVNHINAIMEWGHGSGEEFMDLATDYMSYDEAQTLYDLMKKLYIGLG